MSKKSFFSISIACFIFFFSTFSGADQILTDYNPDAVYIDVRHDTNVASGKLPKLAPRDVMCTIDARTGEVTFPFYHDRFPYSRDDSRFILINDVFAMVSADCLDCFGSCPPDERNIQVVLEAVQPVVAGYGLGGLVTSNYTLTGGDLKTIIQSTSDALVIGEQVTFTFTGDVGTCTTFSIFFDVCLNPPLAPEDSCEELSFSHPILTEVFYNPDGTDTNFEWVELFNPTASPIDLSNYSLGWGGTSYTYGTLQLVGTINPYDTFVVGGPSSDATNFSPVYDQSLAFSPGMQNSGSQADGVALFNVIATNIEPGPVPPPTIPIDAVLYGPNNDGNLIDETGSANPPEVVDAGSGNSIQRINFAGAWEICDPGGDPANPPNPNNVDNLLN